MATETKPAWMKPSNSWNIFRSPRWIRIALATAVVVSACIFLAVETSALDKIPVPYLISHKAAESEQPLPALEPSPAIPEQPISTHEQPPSTPETPPSTPDKQPSTPEKQPSISEKQPSTPEEQPSASEKQPPTIVRPSYLDADVSGTKNPERLAYVTFLTGDDSPSDDLEEDKYFQAIRILVWQFIHKPETRTKHDVIVMVTPTVSQSRRDRLKKDGAIVHAVEFLHTENDSWVHPQEHRWEEVMTKLRVWEMTQYDRIVVLDGDSMLLRNLDPVFDDPAAQLLATKPSSETGLPSTYLLASNSEVWDSSHTFPPTHGTGLKDPGNMNAGFFVLAPSLPMFEYYVSLLNTPNSFDPRYPEQNLMNHAHRWDGPMPWREIAYTWNLRCPNDNDIAQGLYSVHEKWWTQPYIHENKKTKQWLQSRRWEMKGWYDGYEGAS